MQILYGSGEHHLDVTDEALRRCFDGQRIYIPADDNLRARLFPDPMHGVVKELIVTRDEAEGQPRVAYDANTTVAIILSDFERAEAEQRREPRRKITLPPGDLPVEDKVRFIHRQLSFSYGYLEDEWPEQCMVMRFLPADARVLELGANIGRSSLLIASLLEDDRRLVSLESNPASAQLLRNNRYANHFNFNIKAAALSYRPLFQRDWETISADSAPPGYRPVATVTLEQLQQEYSLKFDTLVADCEGGLYPILKDNGSLLANIGLIILEADFRTADEKAAVTRIIRAQGFERIYSKPLVVSWNHPFPRQCADSFFEVWTRG